MSAGRTVVSQESGDPEAWDPWGNDFDEEQVVLEEEGDLPARPLVGTQSQVTCLAEGEGEGIPTSQEMTVREYSATDLVEQVSRLRQGGRQGVAAWVLPRWDTGEEAICGMFGMSEMGPVSAQPALQQIHATVLGQNLRHLVNLIG